VPHFRLVSVGGPGGWRREAGACGAAGLGPYLARYASRFTPHSSRFTLHASRGHRLEAAVVLSWRITSDENRATGDVIGPESVESGRIDGPADAFYAVERGFWTKVKIFFDFSLDRG